MTGQARAARTRLHLVHTAATEIAGRGYDGTSFARICRAAEVTMGALTFHFPTKAALGQAVCTAGIEATRTAVEDADRRAGSALQSVGGVVRVLTGLLVSDAEVRAAARLSREQPALSVDWRSCWFPLVHTRLREAKDLGQLRPGTRPETAALLVGSLVAGLEAGLLPQPGEVPLLSPAPQEHLSELWQLALRGIGVVLDRTADAS